MNLSLILLSFFLALYMMTHVSTFEVFLFAVLLLLFSFLSIRHYTIHNYSASFRQYVIKCHSLVGTREIKYRDIDELVLIQTSPRNKEEHRIILKIKPHNEMPVYLSLQDYQKEEEKELLRLLREKTKLKIGKDFSFFIF